ncbi:hypothetical protein [Burkholderia perseverans]|uniref:hypothetical protein n=1 Tax=Burkholderia perseverans TaxID=2615214 RepID=UPI001FEF6116|nr:hypothetical protein [Burkholderia perseverans]
MDPNGLLGDVPERQAAPEKKSSSAGPASKKAAGGEPVPAAPNSSNVAPLIEVSPDAEPGSCVVDAGSGDDVTVLVLVKCEFGRPNDVVILDARDVQIAKRAGKVCDHENSIAAARTLSRK